MGRILRKKDFIELAQGEVLRSDGGDFPVEWVMRAIEKIDREKPIEIELIDISEMEDETYGLTVMKMGPISSGEELVDLSADGILAFNKMREIHEKEGKKITCIFPGEHCGVLVPFYIRLAQAVGLPLVDADGCGRSVPVLELFLPFVYGDTMNPAVFGDAKGNTIYVDLENPYDSDELENIGRALCMANDNMIAMAFPPVSKKKMEESLYIGSISSMQRTGQAILEAKEKGLDPVEKLLEVLDAKEICRGVVESTELVCRDGFDFGITTIKTENGRYRLLIQNEVIAIKDENENVLLTSPDSASMIHLGRMEGITNSEVKPGMELAVMGIRAAEPWYRIEDGIGKWKRVYHNIGLDNQKWVKF